MMDFEWDNVKARENLKKHGISFDEATQVFADPNILELDDDGIYDEYRQVAIGMVEDELMYVIFTMRGEVCRLISARGAEPHEKRWYHEVPS
jgi:uncharacterized protein